MRLPRVASPAGPRSIAAASPAYELYAPRGKRLRALAWALGAAAVSLLHLHRMSGGKLHL